MANLERDHGSVLGGLAATRKQRRAAAAAKGEPPPRPGRLWSLRDGLGQLIDGLRGRLRQPPRGSAAVRRLQRTDQGWIVQGEDGEGMLADSVALMCPAHQQSRILTDLDRSLAEEIGAIPYNRVAVVALGYRAADMPMSLDGFGYLTPQRERRDVLGVQWCSSIYPGRTPDGCVLLRAMCGGWHRPEMVDWDDQRLLAVVRAELAATMGIRAEPIFHHLVRWDRAIPQYHLGHLARVERIEKRVAAHHRLYLGGNAYRGVALNDCVEQSGRLAERIAAALPS